MFHSLKNINLKKLTSQFIKNEAGVAAVLGAILLPTLIGSAGLAVDGTRYMRAKQIIVGAADKAALAAASVDVQPGGQTREEIASNFFRANVPAEYANVVTLKSFKFADTSADKQGGFVRINYTIDATVKPLVASAVGIGDFSVIHTGEALREIHNVEVVMALPMSGTMCSTKNRTPVLEFMVQQDTVLDLKPDPKCTHFNAMKQGVQSFSDKMFGNQTVSRFKLGLVPYNFKIRMPDTRVIPAIMNQMEHSDPNFFTNLTDANPLPVVLPLTTNRDKINKTIKDLALNENATAWSRTNLPTLASALMLDPDVPNYAASFNGGVMPEPFSNKGIEKVFILMSDGSNIGCCFTNWQPGDFTKQYLYFHKPDNEQQLAYCEAMKKAGITIFTIIFDVSEQDKGGKEINNIFARCASGAYSEKGVKETDTNASLLCKNKQNCYNVSDSKQLVKAYEDIAQNFFISRTSK